MADVTLRSYLHEIEKHIESGRTDQAIAHSKHILQTYPKCVDAYRLLGKAYLENQRYTDAGDIFQRVISSVPDDFVSHVGMSIIREDEGNLNESIWHMERAFEVQPSNGAIQGELRRLYERRDNVAPPRIRLTRGALARLYAKGELYQQAIGEIRAALSENTNRLDLQALLAEIYFKMGQRVEAADTALAVLRHLPNCLVANRIMVQVLAGSEREVELKSYRQKLAQLDPYSAFAPVNQPNGEGVADQAVQLEKLDWKPDQSLTGLGQPAWAASLGVDLGDLTPNQTENLPDWLEASPAETEETRPMLEPEPSGLSIDEEEEEDIFAGLDAPGSEPAQTGEEIPDWLREAGWEPSSSVNEADNTPTIELDFETGEGIVESEDKIEEAEIPDWLKAMAPLEETPPVAAPDEDLNPWLDNLIPKEETVPENEEQPEKAEAAMPELQDETLPPEEEPPAEGETKPAEEIPEWLLELQHASAVPETEMEEASEEEPEAEIPDWLLEEVPEQSQETVEEYQPDAITPDWMRETAQVPIPEDEQAQAEPAAEIPDWLLAKEPEESQGAIEEYQPDAITPDWMQETAQTTLPEEGQAQPESTAEMPKRQHEEEPSAGEEPAEESERLDWVIAAGLVGGATLAAKSQSEAAEDEAEPEQPPAEAGEIPDWLVESKPEEEGLEAQTEPFELPEWLQEAGTIQAEQGEPDQQESEPAVELPDWITEGEEIEAIGEESIPEVQPLEAGIPDWLMETTAPEETEAKPEEVETPEWLTESRAPEAESVEAEDLEAIEMPDWLQALDESQPKAVKTDAAGVEPFDTELEIPDWLREIDEFGAETGEAESLQEAEPASELPDWLLEMQETAQTTPPVSQESTTGAIEEAAQEAKALTFLGDTQPTRVGQPAEAEARPESVVEAPEIEEKAEQIEQASEMAEQPEMLEKAFEAPAPESGEFQEAFAWLMGLQVVQARQETSTNIAKMPEKTEQLEEELSLEEKSETVAEGQAPESPAAEQIEAGQVVEPEEVLFEGEAAQAEEPPREPPVAPLGLAGVGEELVDEDAAFAWLESLAVKQGASEALLLKPEERRETMPDWVKRDAEAAQVEEQAVLAEPAGEEAAPEFYSGAEETPPGIQEPPLAPEMEEEPGLGPVTETIVTEEIETGEPIIEEMLEEAMEEAPLEEIQAQAKEEEALEAIETEAFEAEAQEPPQAEVLAEEVEEAPIESLEEEAETSPAETASAALEAEEEIPELPDWLTEPAVSAQEELDWEPPAIPIVRFDLNEASLSELERLPGIGFITAQNIVNYRAENGPFLTVEDLMQIPGIGVSTLDSIRNHIFVKTTELEPKMEEAPTYFAEAEEISMELSEARAVLSQGKIAQAMERYAKLVQTQQDLNQIARDLEEASYRFPNEINVWQNLGDVYLRLNKVQEALKAYITAEQLLN